VSKVVYTDSQGKYFVVTDKQNINEQLWIFYYRLDSPQLTYSCLAEAFYDRFSVSTL